jgi:hypothetical protein
MSFLFCTGKITVSILLRFAASIWYNKNKEEILENPSQDLRQAFVDLGLLE